MLLKNLIRELDLFLPSPYSAEEKTIFLNKTIVELSRFGGRGDMYPVEGTGQRLYPLPEGIAGENVLSIAVNKREYLPKRVFEAGEYFYTFMPGGFVSIEPPPKVGDEIMIYFSSLTPFKMAGEFESEEEFLAQELPLDTEYKYLLLYGAMADIALSTEDTEMSNNIRQEFNQMKRDALCGRYKKSGKYPKVREVK